MHFFKTGDPKSARAALSEVEQYFESQKVLDQIHVQLWRKMRRTLGPHPIPLQFKWGIGERTLSLDTGLINNDSAPEGGRTAIRLLNALFKDFYRPLSTGALFSEVFPGEHFDVFSSPARVHQSIARTRRWLALGQLPLDIITQFGLVTVRRTGSVQVIVPTNRVVMVAR